MGESFKIGQPVHALLADGRCAPGWVVEWDNDRSTALVQGFRRGPEGSFGFSMLRADGIPHQLPTGTSVVTPITEDTPASSSFHLAAECPWDR